MPDIFLSYNREDQATARRFAEAFQAEGFDVWWDTTLRAGEAYDRVTEKALGDAKAVVVLWSPRSVDSRWVRSEATQADRNGTLVPVTIEPCKRPIMFELTQTAELSHWEGDVRDKVWQAFMGDLKRFVQAAPAASIQEPVASEALGPSPVRQAATDRLSICVLPFANMSRDEDQEYFADGISEDIITDLSKVSALAVIARNSAFALKGKNVDIKQVARLLEVSHVLEGSVRKAGNRVRITAQLISGATNEHVWANRWDRDLDDIFALQDEISEAIVKALKLRLLPIEKAAIEDRGTTNVQAYDIFLRARALAGQFGAANLGRAVELFHEALSLEPKFLQAWSGLVTALRNYANFAPALRTELLAQMDAATERMVEIAPEGRFGMNARAFQRLLRRDYLGAEDILLRAPPSPASEIGDHLVDRIDLMFQGVVAHYRKSQEGFRSLVRQDPLSLLYSTVLQETLDLVGQREEAHAEYLRSRDLSGDHEIAEFFAFLRTWGRAEADAVEAQYQRLLACGGSRLGNPLFSQLAGVLGDLEAASELIAAAFEDCAVRQDAQLVMYLVQLAGLFGNADVALGAMRLAYLEMRFTPMRGMWTPRLAQARQDPRFKEMLRDLGLVHYWRASGNWGDFVRPLGDDDFEVIG